MPNHSIEQSPYNKNIVDHHELAKRKFILVQHTRSEAALLKNHNAKYATKTNQPIVIKPFYKHIAID
ncbi:hypothetical protein AAY55_08070 [Vibrio metoecus]|uniref:Uncharacterized protein n=1 Tax=Vibrio metoecus TaxID=1481663 RepID=A0A0Q0T9P3_VIBMT|nr:hypothetical protein AAY55_08070 [Vibrio metoecus]